VTNDSAPTTDTLVDEYRIDITPGRRRRQDGFRVQVSYHHPEGWRPILNESGALPWQTVAPWRATRQGAFHLGISEAHEIHAMDDPPRRPLVVWHDGVRVVDETAGATA